MSDPAATPVRKPVLGRTERMCAAAWLVSFLALGAFYRLPGSGGLLVGGDEWHTLRVALEQDYWGILTYYFRADNCIPMTLYARALMDTVGLDEWGLRAPVMLAGALLLVLPLVFVRRLGLPVALATIALSATSPMMVFYSLQARPYAPAACLVLVSLALWRRWLDGGLRRHTVPLALAASGAVSLHLFCLFPVLALMGLSAIEARERGAGWRPVLLLAGLVAGVLTLTLGPGMPGLLATRTTFMGVRPFSLDYLGQGLHYLTGFLPSAGIVLLLFGLLGVRRLWSLDRSLGRAVLALLLLQLLAVCVIRPLGPAIGWGRYQYFTWPLMLLAAGAGIEDVVRRLPRGAGGVLGVGLLAAAVALWFPLASPIELYRSHASALRTANFMLRPDTPPPRAAGVAAVLASSGGPGTMILVPYTNKPQDWRAAHVYEQQPGTQVLMADARVSDWRARGLFPDTVLDLDQPEEIRQRGARWILLLPDWADAATVETVRSRYGEPVHREDGQELYRATASSR